MKRKLVKQGAATMMVSLPSKWIKANKLGKGYEVDMLEDNNILKIGVELSVKKNFEVEINEQNRHDLQAILTHAYRRGFEKIILKGKSNDFFKDAKKATNDFLLGFEITDMQRDKLALENILEPTEQKYDVILKKVFQTIDEAYEILFEDFGKNKFDSFQDIEDLRKQQERFVLFSRRLLVKGKSEKNKELHWELLTFLLHIMHELYYLYKFSFENKVAKNKDIIFLLKELKDYYTLFGKAYFEKDLNFIHKINVMKTHYQFGECLRALEKSKGKDTIVLSYIREIFRLIQIGTSPILSELVEEKILNNQRSS